MAAAARYSGKGWKVVEMSSLVASINSVTAITDTSDVSLMRLIRLLDRLGTAALSACGPTT